MTFLNEGTFSQTLSVQDLPVILKGHNVQSLNKALDFFNRIKILNFKREFYSLNRRKKCKLATYNFGSVYIITIFANIMHTPCIIIIFVAIYHYNICRYHALTLHHRNIS